MELTRTAWWRIEREMKAQNRGRVLPIGLANEYIGYVATREEYAAQGYEGASTIYGPYAAEVLRAVFSVSPGLRVLPRARREGHPRRPGRVLPRPVGPGKELRSGGG